MASLAAPLMIDLADALDLAKPLGDDRVAVIVNLGRGQSVGGHRQDHDRRVGGIDLAIGGRGGQVEGQVAGRGVDGRLHVARRAIHVAIEIELDSDRGAARGC